MKIIKQIAKQIKKADKIVLFHHVRPDGDTISSSYGLMKALQLRFPKKEIKWYAEEEYVMKRFDYIVKDNKDMISSVDSSWTAIIGDNAVKERIYGAEEYEKAGFKICFDHHTNQINFDHDLYWQQSDLGASSVQAYQIAKALKVPFDAHAALASLLGILTDTFNFTYSLADTRPVEAAKELMEYIPNEDMDQMYKAMRKKTMKDVNFTAFALSNFKTSAGVAYLNITKEELKKLKMTPDEVARVNTIGNIEGIGIWAFFIEDGEFIKVSLRSNGAHVNEVAKKFGGGGHVRASGIKMENDWKLAAKVVTEAKKQLKEFSK